ncbi:MAG TPA: helix-turn-helix transcriptional regulator [Methylibium sp.]
MSGLGGARLHHVDVALEESALGRGAPAACRVVRAGSLLPVLAESVDRATALHSTRRHRLVVGLLREELQAAEPLAIGIELPDAVSLRAACEAFLQDASDCNLQAMADAAGIGARTLARRFRQELRTSFSEWRLQLRLASVVRAWAEGQTLRTSAAAAGYASPSAFSVMVRRLVGMTPRRLLASRS